MPADQIETRPARPHPAPRKKIHPTTPTMTDQPRTHPTNHPHLPPRAMLGYTALTMRITAPLTANGAQVALALLVAVPGGSAGRAGG